MCADGGNSDGVKLVGVTDVVGNSVAFVAIVSARMGITPPGAIPAGCFFWSHSSSSPMVLVFSNATPGGECTPTTKCICAACNTVLKSSEPLNISAAGDFDLQIRYNPSTPPCKYRLAPITCNTGYEAVLEGHVFTCREKRAVLSTACQSAKLFVGEAVVDSKKRTASRAFTGQSINISHGWNMS